MVDKFFLSCHNVYMAYDIQVGTILRYCWKLNAHKEQFPEDFRKALEKVISDGTVRPPVLELKEPLDNYLRQLDKKHPLFKDCKELQELLKKRNGKLPARYLLRYLFRKII